MTEKTPTTLDRLWEDIPTGQPPIGDLLSAGHAIKRRKRNARLFGVAAATALVIGGVATQQGLTSSNGDRPDSLIADAPASTYSIRVDTTREGPSVYYFEGALQEVHLTDLNNPAHPVEPIATEDSAPDQYAWNNLASGDYMIEGVVRPCSGSCDHLDPPTDTCHQNLTLGADTTLQITFHYGQPCRIAVLDAYPTTVASMTAAAARLSSSYVYDLTSACGERSLLGDFRVVVVDDRVESVTALEGTRMHGLTPQGFPTIADLTRLVEDAEPGADVEVRVDALGLPVSVSIDHDPSADDDEECYRVSRLH